MIPGIVKNILPVSLIFLLSGFIYSQTGNSETNAGQELKNIRADIEKYKNQLAEKKAKEKTLVELISTMDKEIDIAHGYVKVLKKESNQRGQKIEKLKHELEETRNELKILKEIFTRRLVYFYKHGRIRDIELLLSARSLNQALLWLRYEKLVAQNDLRNYWNIQKKIKDIEKKSNLLRIQSAEHDKIVREKTTEEEQLKKSRVERQQFLTQVKKDRDYLLQLLAEQEQAERKIVGLINLQEEKRIKEIVPGEEEKKTTFPQLKGKMIWPTPGKIITRFGKHEHPTLKTITENLGVEIQAPFGANVASVCDGLVTTITWQRGRGNIIIINHYGGYYTVYTHLSEISVELDQKVSIGQTIGKVGDSGSLHGPILHFEIWENTTNLNPEDWMI